MSETTKNLVIDLSDEHDWNDFMNHMTGSVVENLKLVPVVKRFFDACTPAQQEAFIGMTLDGIMTGTQSFLDQYEEVAT